MINSSVYKDLYENSTSEEMLDSKINVPEQYMWFSWSYLRYLLPDQISCDSSQIVYGSKGSTGCVIPDTAEIT